MSAKVSVWRRFLQAILPFLFKVGQSSAEAALKKEDVGEAAKNAALQQDLSGVVEAGKDVVEKTVKSVTKEN